MSYLSDEQMGNVVADVCAYPDKNGEPDWDPSMVNACTETAKRIRDLYEARLKEKDALLRKAVRVMTGVDKWMKLQRRAMPIEDLRALLPRINEHLTTSTK